MRVQIMHACPGCTNLQKIYKPPPNSRCQKGTRTKFRTEDQQFSSDVWTSLLSGAVCMSTDTHFCMGWRNYNIYTENMCHCRTFGCLEFVHPCAY